MRIAFDSGPLKSGHAVRGVGFYTSEILNALSRERSGLERLIIDDFDFLTNAKLLNSGRYDLIHSSFFNPYFLTVPIKYRGKLIVTVHDLIYLLYPKHYPPGIKGRINFLIQKLLIKRASAIITDTETTKKDIVRLLGINESKIKVAYLAAKNVFKPLKDRNKLARIKKEFGLSKKFVLYVGDVNYNKNIPVLVKACDIARVPLVIVGKHASEIERNLKTDLKAIKGPRDWLRFLLNRPHPEKAHYKMLLDEINKNPSVKRLGFVSDEDLNCIYNLATVYCQPSLYEGFGLPVLEAMASGTPVVISKTQALVEIAHDAALIADPDSPEDFAEKIKNLVDSDKLREEFIKRGFKVSETYTWQKTAKATLAVYLNVIKNPNT
ncbi:hypothetical protein A3A76_03750 [Candidatus Woesebacteria bacterium RIFCSPLOWO2_01_FULL_39_23]|uniref:Glycosyl transferase family 1 domain-containing protein n=1 Tax=Candidatus Woesebacteria bacterium RIFCSPHIGHO2_01_FULL_40_22 TaxID=1802499 RepID=A0A1F7YLU4_9BACT|nr:MAG: hypothetical protein A2141_00275 [Candidatus Woesebacteria bacterium RBG_16_40_11]OGM27568.1 MAG: hypothetical protein A2628_02150 [Candidatus Woesebacteria bacterium RIFCSPHIGHO2_01_FULL_40_22]OGM36722.1 MAG: hypothetical protein A3E41_02995 [Candidatus Woesebacteria bacterium RIFCSPHIGHO2_12_FULL_38_9]OGM62742.1 MAG: hypothetical protein A3A76_03750 [Candidatus Woesebacteria bacterium RIFCSPLOWO2_01_FULL_39_23]